MKHSTVRFVCLTFVLLLTFSYSYAQKKTVTRDYIYQANEEDSKVSARAFATRRLHEELLREVGEFLQAEKTLNKQSVMKGSKEVFTEDYSEKIMAITAGVVEMKVLNEVWNGATYYVEAQMTVDPKEVNKRINEVLNDKQKTKELEESRQRALAAEADAERLKKELALEKNRGSEALRQAYKQQTDAISAEEYFIRAYNAYENGWYELAIENYQKAISIEPNLASAYHNMGNAYLLLENYTQAISCYQKTISIKPNLASAYNNMGAAYANLKDYTQAIKCYQKAVSIDPSYAMAYNNMGLAYADLENYPQAISYYQKAISIEPNDADAYNNMGIAYARLKDYTQAIKCYKKIVEMEPNNAEAYYDMGLVYALLENYNQVIQCMQKTLSITPNHAEAYFHIGYCYGLSGDEAQGAINLQKAARLGHGGAQEELKGMGYSW